MSHDSRIALTKDGVSLSRLVFGAWRLLDGGARPDADQVARLIGAAVDLGLTSFDHADIYGNYEVEGGLRRRAVALERQAREDRADLEMRHHARLG